MTVRVQKKAPLTSTQRSNRRDAKMKKFGIKRQYYRASASQRRLVKVLMEKAGCDSREELVHLALKRLGEHYNVTLEDMVKDLECLNR